MRPHAFAVQSVRLPAVEHAQIARPATPRDTCHRLPSPVGRPIDAEVLGDLRARVVGRHVRMLLADLPHRTVHHRHVERLVERVDLPVGLLGDLDGDLGRRPDVERAFELLEFRMEVLMDRFRWFGLQPGQEGVSSQVLKDWFWDETVAGKVLLALKKVCETSTDDTMKLIGGHFIVPGDVARRQKN